ncbi:LCP family protein [Sanguibacter antarcticus]|uniref:LytR family transcriptional attenuator n=1 Tax=Sanguibacter antarcticus TaxID=372484 RepID=A0A2A9E0C9_9MICO|nr:LCP family protein [Sanguibacter antarcticus]PFG32497.1 LytR family transcriptional attenuator [Sanguibacter antarcticus]
MTPTDPSRSNHATPPPSFTPQSGRPGRPAGNEPGIEVVDTGSNRPIPDDSASPSAHEPVSNASQTAPRPAGRIPSPQNPVRRAAADTPGRVAQPPTPPRHPIPPGYSGRAASPTPAQGAPRPASFAPSAGQPAGYTRSEPGAPAQAGGSRTTSLPPTSARPNPARGPVTGRPAGAARPTGVAGSHSAAGSPGGRPPGSPPSTSTDPGQGGIKPEWRRIISIGLVLLLVLVIAWPVGLLLWANGKIAHTDALSGASATDGTTYLLAGSDSRADGAIGEDGTEGARTDTIMLLHVPDSGPTALISIPRDTYAEIPGNGANKLNSSFAWGGAPLLVKTVEGLSGLTVDHYVEVGFSGVEQIVDAVGGVELCLDYEVHDVNSGLNWTPGCHLSDGETALEFSRMRYSDPEGDIGRGERQRQVIGAVSSTLQDKSLLFQPGKQTDLIGSALGVVTVDNDTNILELARLALAFRAANGTDGITGTPPISDLDYRPGTIGSTVRLDPDLAPQFWTDIANGDLSAGTVGGLPG